MSFRISLIADNGSREKTVLIEESEAVISSKDSAQLQCNLPEDVNVTVKQTADKITLHSAGTAVIINGKSHTDTVSIRNASDFEISGMSFYVTSQISKKVTPRKKTYLSIFGLAMVWSLLALMFIVPAVLPSKIRAHEKKDRHALVDKCSNSLDVLRDIMRGEMSKLDSYTQAHRDIASTLNEEVEQMAWAFRTGGDFMNQEKMIKLQEDISRYGQIIKKLKTTGTVNVAPLNSDSVLKSVLPD